METIAAHRYPPLPAFPAILTAGPPTRESHVRGPYRDGHPAGAQGVVDPGQGRTVRRPVLAVTGQLAATGDQRVVLSGEFFCPQNGFHFPVRRMAREAP